MYQTQAYDHPTSNIVSPVETPTNHLHGHLNTSALVLLEDEYKPICLGLPNQRRYTADGLLLHLDPLPLAARNFQYPLDF
jgi:hypothetical protein